MRFKYLDALRGIAVLGVLWVHSAVFSGQVGENMLRAMIGQRGVQLFYVISAFTLFMSLDNRTKQEKHTLGNFFIRRFFRIAPLYYLAIVLNLFYQGWGPRPEAPNGLNWQDIALGFAFLNGFREHTINSIAIGGWSIAVETSFYALVPLLYVWITNLKRALFLWMFSSLFVAALLSELAVRYPPALHPRATEYFGFLWFPVQFPVFCMGIVAYFLWKHFVPATEESALGGADASLAESAAAKERSHWSLILIILAFTMFLSSLPTCNPTLYRSSLSFVPLLLGLALKGWRLFVNPVTLFLGKISYSMYLMHFFVLFEIRRRFVPFQEYTGLKLVGTPLGFTLYFVTLLLLSIGLSYITYLLIEQPGIRLGKYLVKKNEGVPARTVSVTA